MVLPITTTTLKAIESCTPVTPGSPLESPKSDGTESEPCVSRPTMEQDMQERTARDGANGSETTKPCHGSRSLFRLNQEEEASAAGPQPKEASKEAGGQQRPQRSRSRPVLFWKNEQHASKEDAIDYCATRIEHSNGEARNLNRKKLDVEASYARRQSKPKQEGPKRCKTGARNRGSTKASKKSSLPVVALKPSGPFISCAQQATLNGAIVGKISMMSKTEHKKRSFLSLWAGGRVLEMEYDFSMPDQSEPPRRELYIFERYYELLTAQVKDDGAKSGKFSWAKTKKVVLTYIATKGPGLEEWKLKDELEKIADFQSLPPNKVIARFDLFMTDAKYIWDRLPSSSFEVLEEELHEEGCGSMPEEFLKELLNSADAQKKDTVQVRVFGPKIGIHKGMLAKKAGIKKIQLPPSMMKVKPSRRKESDDWVIMVVKGAFPSIKNWYIGRHFDPEEDGPPPKSFADDLKKKDSKMSEMYVRLLVGLGVSLTTIDDYLRKRAITVEGLKHASLKGIDDPMGIIPENHVFITGFKKNEHGIWASFVKSDNIFLTRSPCVEPSDGKVLRIVKEKPENVPEGTWEWYCGSWKFGHVMFGRPQGANPVPLPALVGEGDLDGDDYLGVWDTDILSDLMDPSVVMRMKAEEDEQRLRLQQLSSNANASAAPSMHEGSVMWLEEAQDLALDLSRFKNCNEITGSLYNLCVTKDKKPQYDIYDEDARASGRGFKDSLDLMKHGGVVPLPSRLKSKVKPSLLNSKSVSWK